MTNHESSNASNATSWIISIAVSVVCCAVIFIVFASYITDVKKEVRENSELINAIQDREVSIQQTLEAINRRMVAAASAPVAEKPAVTTPDQSTTTPAIAAPVAASPAISAPAGAEPTAPAAPTYAAPAIQVPVITPLAPASSTAPSAQTPSTTK